MTSASTSSRTSTTEYYSAISSDEEEFYDLPNESDGQITPTNENINDITKSTNGHLVEKALERLENELIEDPEEKELRHLYRTVDELMEGNAGQQRQTFDLLKMKESKVCFVLFKNSLLS